MFKTIINGKTKTYATSKDCNAALAKAIKGTPVKIATRTYPDGTKLVTTFYKQGCKKMGEVRLSGTKLFKTFENLAEMVQIKNQLLAKKGFKSEPDWVKQTYIFPDEKKNPKIIAQFVEDKTAEPAKKSPAKKSPAKKSAEPTLADMYKLLLAMNDRITALEQN